MDRKAALITFHACFRRPVHSKVLPREKKPANLESIPSGESSYPDLRVRWKGHVRLAASLISIHREFWSGPNQETLKTTALQLLFIADGPFRNSAVELQNFGSSQGPSSKEGI